MILLIYIWFKNVVWNDTIRALDLVILSPICDENVIIKTIFIWKINLVCTFIFFFVFYIFLVLFSLKTLCLHPNCCCALCFILNYSRNDYILENHFLIFDEIQNYQPHSDRVFVCDVFIIDNEWYTINIR